MRSYRARRPRAPTLPAPRTTWQAPCRCRRRPRQDLLQARYQRLRAHFKTWYDRWIVSGKRMVFGSGSFVPALRSSASDTQVEVLKCALSRGVAALPRKPFDSALHNGSCLPRRCTKIRVRIRITNVEPNLRAVTSLSRDGRCAFRCIPPTHFGPFSCAERTRPFCTVPRFATFLGYASARRYPHAGRVRGGKEA